MPSMSFVSSIFYSILCLSLHDVNGVEYLMAGQNVGCTNYGEYVAITTKSECETAAVALGTGCSSATELSQNIYPSGCYFNKAGGSCSYRLYFNSDPSKLTGTSTRFPICKISSSPSICTVQLGNVATGGSITPNINDALLYKCSDSWTFSPYSREGRMHFAYNPKEQGFPWGFQQWALDMDATGNTYSTLYNYPNGDSFYDTAEGIAIDNINDKGYTMISHKYGSTGTSYERWLMQIDLNTGVATEILHDYYPYNCYHLNTPSYRAVMDIDETNNILYWMDENPDTLDLALYSLDLNASPLQVVVEILLDYATFSEQLSQLIVDCNGNVWFTEIFQGLYLYKPGWSTAVQMIGAANLNGIQIIRRDNSVEMDWIIASKFTIRKYSKTAIQSQSNTYSTYPSPPEQQRAGSDGDIMHNLYWDYQNQKMCANTRTNDGDFMLFCYDPAGDTNVVWNFIKGPFEREGLGIRFGNMVTRKPTVSPITATPTTKRPTMSPTVKPTASPVAPFYEVCDNMDETSVQYYWSGGSIATSTTGCASQPCFKLAGTTSAQKRISTVGLENIQLRWSQYLYGVDGGSGEALYIEYDCDDTGFVQGASYTTNDVLESKTFDLTNSQCEDNPDIKIRFRITASITSEYAYIDNFCVYGETPTIPSPGPPPALPYCITGDYTESGYFADYVVGSVNNYIENNVTSTYCPSASQCIKFFGYNSPSSSVATELNFIDFNVKGTSDVTINFNLCFDCDSGSSKGMRSNDNFFVNYACDGTFNFKNIVTYNGDSYGHNEYLLNEKIILPAECDDIDDLRVQFAMDGGLYDSYVYMDSFCVNRITDSPTNNPTLQTVPPTTSQPTINPSTSPTIPTSGPTASPTTNVCILDEMEDISLWAEQSLGSISTSTLSTRCQNPNCIYIEYTDSNPISYITRSFDASSCNNICLSYSFGYSYMEGNGENIYVFYSCNNGIDWIQYQYLTNKATGTDYGMNGIYNLETQCNNNPNVLIRFEFHGNDDPDRLYIDNVYLYRGCTLKQQTLSPTGNPSTAPTTADPTTAIPSTNPTTSEPSTNPTTSKPSINPTTSKPTTSKPTVNPTTSEPSKTPTTSEPTTSNPTTSEPTTSAPTTSETTTSETTKAMETETSVTIIEQTTKTEDGTTTKTEVVTQVDSARRHQIKNMFLPIFLIFILYFV